MRCCIICELKEIDMENNAGRFTNPVVSHVLKESGASETCVSYKSVFKKTMLFLLSSVLGVIAFVVLHCLIGSTQTIGGTFVCSTAEIAIASIASVLAVVMSFVASWVKSASGVCGTICCVSYGILLGFLAVSMPEVQGIMLLALVFTIAVVAVMAVLYYSGLVKVTQKLRTFVTVAVFSMLIGSLLFFLCCLIPAFHNAVTWFYKNTALSIICAILGVALGVLFLMCDFDSIANAVENGVDKSYENCLAFGLAFSVIWLYFKIFELLVRLLKRNE